MPNCNYNAHTETEVQEIVHKINSEVQLYHPYFLISNALNPFHRFQCVNCGLLMYMSTLSLVIIFISILWGFIIQNLV